MHLSLLYHLNAFQLENCELNSQNSKLISNIKHMTIFRLILQKLYITKSGFSYCFTKFSVHFSDWITCNNFFFTKENLKFKTENWMSFMLPLIFFYNSFRSFFIWNIRSKAKWKNCRFFRLGGNISRITA